MSGETALARRLRLAVMTTVSALIVVLVWWRLVNGLSAGDVVLVAALTLPLWIALPRLLAGHRRTYAWMTLAVTPFLVLAVTEAVANPTARLWAALCLFVAFTLFVMLVAYLRLTRATVSGEFSTTDEEAS
jgi:uncharacterized membrane protein